MLLRRRKPRVALDDLPQQRAAWAPDPLRAALKGELHSAIGQAMAALPESLRVVVELRDIEGLSTEEAAERLDLTPGAVKVRLHRARLKLRETLSGYLASPTETDDDRTGSQP